MPDSGLFWQKNLIMTNRRSFIRQTATLLGSLALHQTAQAAFLPALPKPAMPHIDPVSEADFWRQIRMAYACSPSIINLNNGGVSPSPRATMDALDYYNRLCNEAPSFYMWRVLDQDREPLRYNLAQLAGADPDEIALNRNATESLNTVIFGLNLKAGDEVVLCKYDYPNMIHAWRQREKRDGIRLVWVDLDLPSTDRATIVNAYLSKCTDKTRVVHLTHIINWCGQILPVRAIADAAHARGIEVLVDGAHSFALLDFKIPDLGADYFGTSLHKWLCAPFGNGMLWIKKEKIANVWALLSSDTPDGDNIRKFEHLGTRNFPVEMATGYSLDLHNLIGAARKQKRLHFLKNYWMEQVKDLPGIRFFTPLEYEWGCAIGTFGFDGMSSAKISQALFDRWKIHTTNITWEKIDGARVTPNVYTTPEELDKLVVAIKTLASER